MAHQRPRSYSIESNLKETEMKANETKVYTKAMNVEQAYYTAAWDNNTHSEGCYSLAVHAAWELGGVEVQNANDDGSTSYAPSRTFEFDDSSSIYIMCGGTYVIEPSAWS